MVRKLPRNKYFSNDGTRSSSEEGQAPTPGESCVLLGM